MKCKNASGNSKTLAAWNSSLLLFLNLSICSTLPVTMGFNVLLHPSNIFKVYMIYMKRVTKADPFKVSWISSLWHDIFRNEKSKDFEWLIFKTIIATRTEVLALSWNVFNIRAFTWISYYTLIVKVHYVHTFVTKILILLINKRVFRTRRACKKVVPVNAAAYSHKSERFIRFDSEKQMLATVFTLSI